MSDQNENSQPLANDGNNNQNPEAGQNKDVAARDAELTPEMAKPTAESSDPNAPAERGGHGDGTPPPAGAQKENLSPARDGEAAKPAEGATDAPGEKPVTADKPAAAKPAAAAPAAKKEEAPPEPPKPGEFGQKLLDAGYSITPLGEDAGGLEVIEVLGKDLVGVAEHLRDAASFDLLISVSGVDRKTNRESVVHLYSTITFKTLVIKTPADANETVPSLYPVWPAADWHEREAYDLFGINYEGHPNLKRILMPIDWIGHPLRKDYTENDPRLVWNRR